MQKSPNKEKFKIYYGYTCPCCSISKEFFRYREHRNKHKEEAKKEIEEALIGQLAESAGLNPVQ